MAMHVFGAGVGRTGTYSLKLAVNRLGLGPCHHMEAVLHGMPVQVPLWNAALNGRPDWQSIYEGFSSAVDWPTARFFRELHVAYPAAKFVLTHRSPESWADSFGTTIHKLIGERDQAPPEMRDWLDMAALVIEQTGFPPCPTSPFHARTTAKSSGIASRARFDAVNRCSAGHARQRKHRYSINRS